MSQQAILSSYYLVTPDNIGRFDDAARRGNRNAKCVMQAVVAWAAYIDQGDHDCHCLNPRCPNRSIKFDPHVFEPLGMIVLTPELDDPNTRMVVGICRDCIKIADFDDMIKESLQFLLDTDDAPSKMKH